jgi:hypothetical protein
MRTYDAPTLAALQTRAGVIARVLVWATARNRGTGLPETLGLWTGGYDRSFTIGGTPRTYVGAGALTKVSPIVLGTGLTVRMQRLTLSPLSQVVVDLIRTYDARFAPIEIHRALFSTGDGALIAEPHRIYKGFIDEVEIKQGEVMAGEGGDASCDISVASTARLLTRTLPLKKSDETQKLRSDDRFRRYVDVSGSVEVWWGERRSGASGGAGLNGPSAGLGNLTGLPNFTGLFS